MINKTVFISGKKLDLVPVEKEHAKAFLPFVNDPETRIFFGRRVPLNLFQEEKWVETLSDKGITLSISEKKREEL